MQQLNAFQDKRAANWVTWLAGTQEEDLKKATVLGIGGTVEASTKDFVRKLNSALKKGTIIIRGNESANS